MRDDLELAALLRERAAGHDRWGRPSRFDFDGAAALLRAAAVLETTAGVDPSTPPEPTPAVPS